jgi:intracellular sulfur oxidation DsrE/DsrF family protein
MACSPVRALALVVLLAVPAAAVTPTIDVPVKLKRARVALNVDQALLDGGRPVVFVWLDVMLGHFATWRTHAKLLGVVHGPAGRWALTDAAWNRVTGETGGNPYAAQLAALQARGVRFEICAYTLEANDWTNADLLPGVQVTTGAIVRLIDLQHHGWTILQP